MKRLLLPLALVAVATSARAADAAAAARPEAPVMTRSGPGQAISSKIVTAKAKVVAVDQANRVITLEGADGRAEKLVVGPEVKRLNEIAAGDTIRVKYRQGVVLQFAEPGSTPAPSADLELQRAGRDKAPAGSMNVQLRGQVTVIAVDVKTRTAVLETAQGELVKVKADKSIPLAKVKAGQKYDGVYTESVAISVEKAKPQKM